MKKIVVLLFAFFAFSSFLEAASIDDFVKIFPVKKRAELKNDFKKEQKINLNFYGPLPKNFWQKLRPFAQRVKIISLEKCSLKILPNWIHEFKSLKSLNVSENNLTMLPKSIVQLKNLEELAFVGNEIKELPSHFEKLNKLKYLIISGNRLKKMPTVPKDCQLTYGEQKD